MKWMWTHRPSLARAGAFAALVVQLVAIILTAKV
jgi:hypothetical protein